MRVEVWSDVVCPWCYVGKRRLEEALARFEGGDEVEVVWRAFQLDPSAPAERTGRYEEHLASKYGTSLAQAEGMTRHMTEVAAADGLDFRFDLARPGRTADAHRLLRLAAERGVQGAVAERLFRATFTEGEPIGDHDTLVRLVAEAGLDAAEARAVLTSDRYAAEVEDDQRQAVAFGASGVPFFVVDRRYGVAGAQPAEVVLGVLRRAAEDARGLTLVAPGGGDSAAGGAAAPGCEGDACAV